MGRPPTISREQLLQAARKVFTQKGFDSATLADIAGELGVTAAAVLRHFDSKQALFHAAMRGNVTVPDCILRLQEVDAATDPRVVLRNLAQEWLPFARTTIVQNLVLSMHERSNPMLVVPFDPRRDDSPPRRGLRIVSDYFRRAKEAGVIRVEDPRAAALLFMGSLVSYIFIHHVLNIVEPAYPADAYIDALIDLWTEGAFVESKHGGTSARNKVQAQENRSDRDSRDRRDRAAGVHAAAQTAETGGPVGNARSEDGERRLARGRTRRRRVRR